MRFSSSSGQFRFSAGFNFIVGCKMETICFMSWCWNQVVPPSCSLVSSQFEDISLHSAVAQIWPAAWFQSPPGASWPSSLHQPRKAPPDGTGLGSRWPFTHDVDWSLWCNSWSFMTTLTRDQVDCRATCVFYARSTSSWAALTYFSSLCSFNENHFAVKCIKGV